MHAGRLFAVARPHNCRLRAPRTVRSCAVVRSAFSETASRRWSLSRQKLNRTELRCPQVGVSATTVSHQPTFFFAISETCKYDQLAKMNILYIIFTAATTIKQPEIEKGRVDLVSGRQRANGKMRTCTITAVMNRHDISINQSIYFVTHKLS